MTYYYFLFGFTLFFGLIMVPNNGFIRLNFQLSQKKRIFIFIYILIFAFSFLVGLRHISVGADTWAYERDYFVYALNNFLNINDPEIFTYLIALFSQIFSKSFQVFLIIHALLLFSIHLNFIKRNSLNLLLSSIILLGMFFIQSMNLMRQWMAIGFGLLAYDSASRNKKITSYFFVFLAILNHLTAIVTIIFPILFQAKNKIRLFYFLVLLSIISYYLIPIFLEFVIIYFPDYSGYIYQEIFEGVSGFNIKDLVFGVIFIALIQMLIFNKGLSRIDKNQIIIFMTLIYFVLVFSLFGQIYGILHRFTYYFSIFLTIIVPYYIKKSKIKYVIELLTIASMLFMLYRNSYWDNNKISEYLFYWM